MEQRNLTRSAPAAEEPFDAAHRLVEMMNRSGPELIRNLETSMRCMRVGDLDVPISVNDGRPTCYINAPSVAFVDYAIEEMRHFAPNPLLRGCLVALARACRPVLRLTGWDRQVQINNWLISTNPSWGLTAVGIVEAAGKIQAEFPEHAVVIRSLNEQWDAALLADLRRAGFRLVPMRQVYLMPRGWEPITTDARRDRRLLDATTLERISGSEFSVSDFKRAEALYAMLYLDKYTALNPQYTARYLLEMVEAKLLDLVGFRRPGSELLAIAGLLRRGSQLVCPILGYDTTRSAKEGLYRLLSAEVSRRAEEEGLLANRSAGAGTFKRLRGMVPALEYIAILDGHLPWQRRAAGWLVQRLLTSLAVPIVRRRQL